MKNHSNALRSLAAGGEMGERIRAFDWSKTPLGPLQAWPQSLLTSVTTCLSCAFPIVLWWGPDLVILYNDEYRPMLGSAKHPGALGTPAAVVWPEIWDTIGPMLAQVMERGEATRSRDLLLHIDRGYPEEAYFSFSYSPIYKEDGTVGGVFCPVIETTEKVIGERRLRTLRDLAARCKGAESEAAAYTDAADVLKGNPYDVPFALIYRIDQGESFATLAAAVGIAPGTPLSPRRVELRSATQAPWSLDTVARSGRMATLAHLPGDGGGLPMGAWKIPPHTAVVLPVLLPGQERPRAIVVAGVSPMRALDEDHATFFNLLATQIASGVADAEALQEERRRAEALAEIDRAKTAFFSNVSHEFRTPLTLMVGPIEDVLAEPGLDERDRERLQIAQRNSRRLSKLVNTLLDFSRIEAGRVQASYEPTDLAALTADLASVFRSAIERAGLTFVVDCPPLPGAVYVDREMWEKIVLNLLSNALKFTFEGEIRVELRPACDHVQLRVMDTGVGISRADMDRVFERFHRIRDTRARTHEGTGIGLALVQELARLHGGTVAVASQEGRGTTFTVSIRTGTAHLPADRLSAARELTPTRVSAESYVEEAVGWLPDADRTSHSRATVRGRAASGTGVCETSARLLIADDNADMRDYLGRILGERYRVDLVADGQAALDYIRRDPPDLVLTDVMMPNLDGFGLLAAVRGDERTRALPIVLLSARAGEDARIEGLQAGADEYLVKPFTTRELLACVGSQLQLSRLRREAERALRYEAHQAAAARARLAAIVDSAEDAIIAKDLDGIITSCNIAAERLFGYTSEELVGKPVRILIPEDRQAEEDDILAHLRRGERIEHFETVRVTKDGRQLNIALTISPVRDETGRVIGASKIARDITAIKQAEAERVRLLQENAAVMETLNNVGALVASDLDRTRVVQAVTDAGTEMTGAEFGAFFYNVVDDRGEAFMLFTISGVARESFTRFPMPRNTEVFAPTFKGTGPVRSADITKDPRYGHNAPYHGMPPGHLPVRSYLAVPVKGRRGETIGGLFFGHPEAGRFGEHHERIALGIASWATVALENAQLYASVQDASRIKDEFLASLSHELRTPLNAILGYARMLKSGMIPSEKKEKAVDTIERNATSLTQIVEDVLDISRIVSGKIRLTVQPVDFPAIVRTAVDAVAPTADAKGVRLESVLDSEASVSGDPERLQQILWNLLSNAVKFTKRDGKVQVRLERVDSHIELTVSDTGIGIAPEFLPYVFERFRQADAGTTRERGGLGLGLSIARQLTEMHGGTIEASSAGLGQGASFRVKIPLMIVSPAREKSPRVHPKSASASGPIAASALNGIHVLAVDDEPDALALLAQILEATGARITTAQSADEALAKLVADIPDVVVADLGMPHVDGFGFIDRLRHHEDPRVREVPAAALTAYARSEDRVKALQAGFQIHLVKPIDPAELVTTIVSLAKRVVVRSPGTPPESPMA